MRNLLDTASIAQNLDGNRLTGSLQIPVSGYLDRHPLQRKGRMGPWLSKQPNFKQFIGALTVTFDTERFIEFDHIRLFDHAGFKIVVLNDLK